jgi:Ferritin-like domain
MHLVRQEILKSTQNSSLSVPTDNADVVQKEIERHSKANIEDYTKASTFVSEELHEVNHKSPQKHKLQPCAHPHSRPSAPIPTWNGGAGHFPRNLARCCPCQHQPTWILHARHRPHSNPRNFLTAPSIHRFFKRPAAECLADGTWFESYLIQRGGRCIPSDILASLIHFPENPFDPGMPIHEALLIEKAILEDLYLLCRVASKHNDYVLEYAIVSRFLRKEIKHVEDMGDLLQLCVRVLKAGRAGGL